VNLLALSKTQDIAVSFAPASPTVYSAPSYTFANFQLLIAAHRLANSRRLTLRTGDRIKQREPHLTAESPNVREIFRLLTIDQSRDFVRQDIFRAIQTT